MTIIQWTDELRARRTAFVLVLLIGTMFIVLPTVAFMWMASVYSPPNEQLMEDAIAISTIGGLHLIGYMLLWIMILGHRD